MSCIFHNKHTLRNPFFYWCRAVPAAWRKCASYELTEFLFYIFLVQLLSTRWQMYRSAVRLQEKLFRKW